MNPKNFQPLIKSALREDIGKKDITTEAMAGNVKVKALIISKGEGIIAGLQIVKIVFRQLSKDMKFKELVKDGDKVHKNQILINLNGKAKTILAAERTALNFLNHLSGIATLTSKYVEKIKHCKCKILDTRKTTPGLRQLEKYAVRMGGGYNHRRGLYDMVLIKDNHLKLICLSEIKKVITLIRKRIPKGVKIEIEVNTPNELKRVYDCGADIIMLDNMSPSNIKKAVNWVKIQNAKTKNKILLEASGKVNLSNVKEIAETGIDFISIGEITHSAPAFDTSLEIINQNSCKR